MGAAKGWNSPAGVPVCPGARGRRVPGLRRAGRAEPEVVEDAGRPTVAVEAGGAGLLRPWAAAEADIESETVS